VRYGSRAPGAREILELGSRGGALMLGFPRCGELRTGWAADLAAFDVKRLPYAGAQADPLAALVFAGIDHTADWTLVNGRVVVEHGRIVGMDEDRLAHQANAAAARLLAGV